MRLSDVLVHSRRCLSATVAVLAIETQSGNDMLTSIAFECDAAVRSLSGVLPHNLIVVVLPGLALGMSCPPFDCSNPPLS